MHFQEPTHWDPVQKESGWIEVVCGSMFSGKTEELIRRVKRAQIAKQKIQIFKPAMDTRFALESVVSHSSQKIAAQCIQHPEEILSLLLPEVRVVGVDEAQFLAPAIVDICQKMAESGIRVIVAGLDLDYLGVPFGPMPKLMALAEHVTKMHAICTTCGSPASRSQRIERTLELPMIENQKSAEGSPIYVGAEESYQARCRKHFKPRVEQL